MPHVFRCTVTYTRGYLTGNALPLNLRGQKDDTFYTHYSSLSTVQANWGLRSLGRQDTNASVHLARHVIEYITDVPTAP